MSGGHQEMWRWQSLRDYVWHDILRWRKLQPEKVLFTGYEWNVPGHEHCSIAIVDDNPTAISAFEYMFDASDDDTSREGEETEYGVLTKQNSNRYEWVNGEKSKTSLDADGRHADAVAACAWMQEQYDAGKIDNAWIIWAHIERKGPWDPANGKWGYNIESFRDFSNAAPDICFGFEGIPGHQASGGRGGFGSGAFGGTLGGAGYYTAIVGGLWDAMLCEGRRWFNYASSDYHWHAKDGGGDFYPGEYQKTYVYVEDANNVSHNAIADALRSGNSWNVMGDLINYLDFSAVQGDKMVAMGGEMDAVKDQDVTLTIKFTSPAVNHNGDVPVVDHVDLIAGEITGMVSPDSPDYTKASNDSVKVIATFTAADWTVVDGMNVITTTVPADKSMYYRLRGTDIAPNTPFETAADGNPLFDTESANLDLDRAAEAWAELWFYSNPIFVYAN